MGKLKPHQELIKLRRRKKSCELAISKLEKEITGIDDYMDAIKDAEKQSNKNMPGKKKRKSKSGATQNLGRALIFMTEEQLISDVT